MAWLTWLQESALSQWVGAAETLLAYPTILTLHTVGLSIVVGTCALLDLRLLGIASDIPLAVFRGAPRLIWTAFAVNALTGALLFLPDAEHKAFQLVFYVKLACIFAAMALYVRTSRVVFGSSASEPSGTSTGEPFGSSTGEPVIPAQARALAMLSLVAWTGATVAGRLMAYIL